MQSDPRHHLRRLTSFRHRLRMFRNALPNPNAPEYGIGTRIVLVFLLCPKRRLRFWSLLRLRVARPFHPGSPLLKTFPDFLTQNTSLYFQPSPSLTCSHQVKLYDDCGQCTVLAKGSVSPSWTAQHKFVLVDDDGKDNMYTDPTVDIVPFRSFSPEQGDSLGLPFTDYFSGAAGPSGVPP